MRLAFLLTSVIVVPLIVLSCSDGDCPICPVVACENENYDGRLYVTTDLPSYNIYVFDSRTDSLIDSIPWTTSPGEVDVSKDGRYLAASDRVYEAGSLQEIAVLSPAIQARFAREGSLVIGRRGELFYTFSVAGFPLLSVDTIEHRAGLFDYCETTDEVFALRGGDTLFTFTPGESTTVRTWRITHPPDDWCYLYHFDIDEEGNTLYAVANTTASPRFLVYDLVKDTMVNSFALSAPWGSPRIHPAGREVWVTDPGDLYFEFHPGTIYVFDAESGDFKGGISLYGYLADRPWIGLDARGLEFAPDGSHAYVRTGHILRQTGTVVRIDCQTRQVENLLFADIDRIPLDLAVGPKPVNPQ